MEGTEKAGPTITYRLDGTDSPGSGDTLHSILGNDFIHGGQGFDTCVVLLLGQSVVTARLGLFDRDDAAFLYERKGEFYGVFTILSQFSFNLQSTLMQRR